MQNACCSHLTQCHDFKLAFSRLSFFNVCCPATVSVGVMLKTLNFCIKIKEVNINEIRKYVYFKKSSSTTTKALLRSTGAQWAPQ